MRSFFKPLLDVMVDVRECGADDRGDADVDDIGDVWISKSAGIDEDAGSLNIYNMKRKLTWWMLKEKEKSTQDFCPSTRKFRSSSLHGGESIIPKQIGK